MARSTWVAHAFEWEKMLKCHLKGKASKKLANGQNIDYSEKRKRPKGFICPCTGVKYHNIQTCLLVYAADSGERLQDHWSSGTVHGISSGNHVYGCLLGVGVGCVSSLAPLSGFLHALLWADSEYQATTRLRWQYWLSVS